MTDTAQTVITGALRKLGVLRKGEVADAGESSDALTVLNDMIASWSLESLLIYATTTDALSISPASSYSIGTGQTLNTERPLWIKAATITISGIDYEVTVIPEDDFQTQISQKSISTTIPQYLTYNNAYPYGTIKLWPTLSAAATLTIMSEKQLSSFAALTTTFNMPPGWSHALKTNLTVLLYPEYGLPADQGVMAEAMKSKGNIKRQVIKAHPITYKDDTNKRFSIYTGY